MLRRLSVSNYILIDSLEIEFDPRLNIITGETGARKVDPAGGAGAVAGQQERGCCAARHAAQLRDRRGVRHRRLRSAPLFRGQRPGLRRRSRRAAHPNSCRQEPRLHQRPAGAARTAARVRQPAHRHPFAASEPDPRLGGVPHRSARYRGRQRRAAGGVSRQIRAFAGVAAHLRPPACGGRRGPARRRVAPLPGGGADGCAPACGEVAELEAEQAVLANADRIGEAITAVRNAFDGDEIGCWRRSRTPRWRSDGWAGVIPTPQTCPGGCVRCSKSSKTSPRRSPRTASASRPTPNGCRRWTTVSIRSIRFARSTVRPTRAN